MTAPARILLLALLAVTATQLNACAASRSPYQSSEPNRRDTAKAERLTRGAAELIDIDPVRAESILREALAADLYHGPAHNNLGVLYLSQDRLYDAANEFEWARKLMPGHPGPRINLGLALERGGRPDEAIEQYRAALESTPEHLGATQALVRCQLRYDEPDEHTADRLGLIAQRSTPAWRHWAIEQISELNAPD